MQIDLSALLASGAFKRFLVFLVSALFLALKQKFGIDIDQQTQLEIVGLVFVYLAQSGYHAGKKAEAAGLAAANGITDVDAAIDYYKALKAKQETKTVSGPTVVPLIILCLIGSMMVPSMAYAQDPQPMQQPIVLDDTPLLNPMKIQQGEASPVTGVVMTSPEFVAMAKRDADCHAQKKVLTETPSTGGMVLVGLVAGVVGLGLGAGISYVLWHPGKT